MVKGPTFSIVIPTRNRAATLHFALLTCLNQRGAADFEVIVCDNHSADDTAGVVRRLESDRVKYIRSDRPLAMSDNWELALSHAKGEYITVLGDDDGLLLSALADAERVLAQADAKALRWDKVYYHWPDQTLLFNGNYLAFSMPADSAWADARETINDVINARVPYAQLPLIYNSFIHRSLTDGLRKRAGRVFGAITPEVYSGICFALMMDRYVSVGRPLSIEGVSAKSNGAAQFGDRKAQNDVFSEFQTLNAAAGLRWHKEAPEIPRSIAAIVSDSFWHAKDVAPETAGLEVPTRRAVAKAIADELLSTSISDDEWGEALTCLHAYLATEAESQSWLDAEYASKRPRFATRATGLPGYHNKRFSLNAADFGISDTYGLALFIENLFGFSGRGLWVQPSPPVDGLHAVKRAIKELTPPVLWRGLQSLGRRLRS